MDAVVVIRERLTRVEESTKSSHHRIDTLESNQREIHNLALSVNSVAQSVQSMAKNLEELGTRVCSIEQRPAAVLDDDRVTRIEERLSEIEQKPAKDWDRLRWMIISAVVSFVAGATAAHFGIG